MELIIKRRRKQKTQRINNMENKNKPAYPVTHPVTLAMDEKGNCTIPLEGLTKRELFAMAAMQGLISSGNGFLSSKDIEYITDGAVKYADELLKQLES